MNTALKIILGVLIVAAAFLGFKIYQKQATLPTAVVKTPATKPVTTAQPAQTVTTKNVTTPEGQKILASQPTSASSAAEQQAFADSVFKAAVSTTSINISSCVAGPTVSSVINDSNVLFVNDDAVEHVVVFNSENIIKVPAKSNLSVKAAFGKGPGIYGFGCDSSDKAVGMVVVK
jgi:hypothetical protein